MDTLVWELCGNFSSGIWLGNFSLVAWKLSFTNFNFETLASALQFANFSVETVVWNFNLGTSAWKLRLWILRLGPFAQDLSFGIIRLGNLGSGGRGNQSRDTGGTAVGGFVCLVFRI